MKILEDRSQVSFLYDRGEDHSDLKVPNNKKFKNERKSIKRTQEKSTVKKMGKSTILEERVTKMEDKLKFLYKKFDEDGVQHKKSVTQMMGRTSKKSTSTLR